MKDALAQEQEPVVYQCPRCATSMQVDLTAKAALAQPTQEPVAWVDPTTLHHLKIGLEGVHLVYETEMVNSLPLYDKPQFQNPKKCLERLIRIMGTFDLATGHADTFDALLDSLESELRDVLGYYRQQRTWVGLTEEEFQYCVELKNSEAIVEEVEAKLKELNT